MNLHKPTILHFPKSPGVYLMKDSAGVVIYVGKAKNLRSRIQQYFAGHDERPQIRFLLSRVAAIDHIVTATEDEALLLENTLIKKHRPRYNFFLKDDKTYLSLKMTAHEFPRLVTTRAKDEAAVSGEHVYGPFTSAQTLYAVKDFIDRYFLLRTCTDSDFSSRKRPCIEYQIKRCSAPCVGTVSREEYAKQIESVRLFLEGKSFQLKHKVKEEMRAASLREDFEEAARLRDLLFDMALVVEGQKNANRFHRGQKKNAGGATGVSPLLQHLRDVLHLKEIPHRIECYDISNISGTNAVGSMVTFVDGKKFSDGYRKFRCRGAACCALNGRGGNDYAMMAEVLKRRFRINVGAIPCLSGRQACNRPKKMGEYTDSPLPNMILIDGGRGQLSIALRVLQDLKITNIDAVAIAKGQGAGARAKGEWKEKKSEEIYIVGRKNPIILKPYAAELKLLQVIRDEAHRFAITYHRKLREKELTHSRLDNIAGVGPVLKARLIKHFGSPEAVLRASQEELVKVRGVTKAIAGKLRDYDV